MPAAEAMTKAPDAMIKKPVDAAMAKTKKPAAVATAPAAKPLDAKGLQQARITECGKEWTDMKAAKKVPAGQTWAIFWVDCSTKMKAAGK